MSTIVKLADENTDDPKVRAIFADIKATKKIDRIPNIWRALASPHSDTEFCQAWLALLCRQLPGVKAGVVEKSGAWFSFNDERIGQGRENAKQFLKDNPDVASAIEEKIRAGHGPNFGVSGGEDGGEVMEA